jgi:uncharacterized protein YbjT (DUF2867 family)
LCAQGERVRALVRTHEADRGSPDDVEAVAGDLGEPESLRTAMSGAEKVFLLSSPHRDAVRWHRNAIDAAIESGVGLLVRSSILGANLESPAEFVSAHTDRDRYLQQSGLEYVTARPNLFTQNVPESNIPHRGRARRRALRRHRARGALV